MNPHSSDNDTRAVARESAPGVPATDIAVEPREVERFVSWTDCVHASPKDVARGLRVIADRIEACELTLVSIYSTGFGEPWEAALQVIATEFVEESQ